MSPRRAAAVLLALAIGLVALGIWQLERRAWKHALIAAVDARVHATPQAAPGPADWSRLDAARDAYRRVTVRGHYLAKPPALVQAVTDLGAGFWVLAPFDAGGFVVLVNRGFVPLRRAAPPPQGTVRVTGLLRMGEQGGAFLRHNDPAADRWYARDVAAIGRARDLARVAPYFIDADATANPGGYPIGGLTVVRFPDNHLVYAFTWFGLALLAAGHAVRLLRQSRRREGLA